MSYLTYKNLNESSAFKELSGLTPPSLKELLTAERVRECSIEVGGGLTYNYAAKRIDNKILETLHSLSSELQLTEKYRALLNGAVMNSGEERLVLHHLTRGVVDKQVVHGGDALGEFYERELEKIARFTEQIHEGHIKNPNGKPFDTVVQIGIGGSDLGPRALYFALENLLQPFMKVHFISNVDPDDVNSILNRIDVETTLFILVSKSGTTQETLANLSFVKKSLVSKKLDPSKHVVAVTSQTSPLANSDETLASFYIDDFIGGRYSSTSAVGGVLLSLAFGGKVFRQLLNGAHEADKRALNSNIKENAALLDALIGVYERNVMGCSATAVLPYSQALIRFPAHLQQLDMESNGKQVNRDGKIVDYKTGPIIFGEPGTNGQHSFYQLLHQGTDVIPLQFIGFENSQINNDFDYKGSTGQTKLKANLVAQIGAFALGREDSNSNKNFPGERPSSLIYGKKLTPEALGALLSHYENKVMFQGFIWNINSFDQEGVQLGKILTDQILKGEATPLLSAYSALLKV